MKQTFPLLLIIISLLITNSLSAQLSIAEARLLPLGTEVNIRGVILNGSEFGDTRYIQDSTAGIAIYDPLSANQLFRGDDLEITGILAIYNGLLQLNTISIDNYYGPSNTVDSQIILPNQMNSDKEAELVKMENINFLGSGNFMTGPYVITDGAINGIVYIPLGHPLIGEPIPTALMNLTGIVSNYNNSFQLLPRDEEDIESLGVLEFIHAPYPTDIQTNSLTIAWETNVEANYTLKYGLTTNLELGTINGSQSNTSHSFTIDNLEPASFYYVSVIPYTITESINGVVDYFSTKSNSTGEINVYFNFPVDNDAATNIDAIYFTPLQIEEKIIEKIDAAQSTIDVSIFGFDRQPILGALVNAANRGVDVRLTIDYQNTDQLLEDINLPFSYLPSNSNGLMHNKFMVIDADSVNDCWVLSGSLNWTESNIWDDPNNILFIQDQALAKAYTIEFEEQWGSNGIEPNEDNAKFGSNKTDNTPHHFMIGDVYVESYFSPSDQVNDKIYQKLKSGEHEMAFALFSFTANELGSMMLDKYNDGVNILGIMENINDQGEEFTYLTNNDVPFYAHYLSGQLHHKYGIIDYKHPDSDPMVITGSHNWTFSANTINDENTLVLHSATLANVYYQEFVQRLCDISVSNCYTGIGEIDNIQLSLFPLPAYNFLTIITQDSYIQDFKVISLSGAEIQVSSSIYEKSLSINTETIPNGVYLIQLTTEKGIGSARFIVHH